jgi:hypothetical protein
MHWRVKLTDWQGADYWLTDRVRMWSDNPSDALHFLCEETAIKAKRLAEARRNPDPGQRDRIRVIKFN